jgi:hypothetical protein
MRSARRTDFFLLLGMALGAAFAGFGLVRESEVPVRGLAADVVAEVNGKSISRAQLETALGLLARDRERSATREEERHVLERLIDEELLFQRGMALGLVESDRKLRGDLVAAVVAAATAEAEAVAPSDADLRAFHEANRLMFTAPSPLRVAQVFVATATRGEERARALAVSAAERLRAGEDLAEVRADLGDPPAVEIPDVFVPPSKLRDYVGPTAAAAALAAEVGVVVGPQFSGDGYRVLLVLERPATANDTFDARREDLLAEFRRRAAEKALRDTLSTLRDQADLAVAQEPAPAR